MPFDGTTFPSTHAVDRIDAVITLIGDERRWCKGALFNGSGQMCIAGALKQVEAETVLRPLVVRAAREVTGRHFWTVESFNDSRSTTHDVVMTVLYRTRENIVGGRSVIHAGRPAIAARCRAVWRGLRQRAWLPQ
jgi:hypothetical protein